MVATLQQTDHFKYTDIPPKQREDESDGFEAKVLKTVREYYDLGKESRARRYYLWMVADLFAKGIPYFDYDPFKGTVEEWSAEKISKCMYAHTPLLQYAVEVIASQYTTSNGRPIPMPVDSSDPKVKAVVRSLQEFADHLDWEFYRSDPHQRQTEAKLIPLRGVYNFLEYDKKAGRKLQVPQYEGQSQGVCVDCGYEVDNGDTLYASGREASTNLTGNIGQGIQRNDEMAQGRTGTGGTACPHCGSPNIQQMTLGLSNQGMLNGRTGALKRHIIDSFQVDILDRGRGIPDSKHLICDEIMFKTEAKQCYRWLKDITGAATLGSYESGFLGLHYLSQLQILIGNTGKLDQYNPSYADQLGPGMMTASYYGSFLNKLLCWRRRAWLDYEVYADWDIEKPITLPGTSQQIPAGGKWGEVFPDGMCLHILNGDTIVKFENQNKNKVWSYVGYRVPSAGLHGTGVHSLVPLNRGYDEANSFGMQALLMAALGIIIADERVPRAENIPGRTIRIPQDARMPNEPIASLVARLDMGGGAAIQAAEPIKESFRGAIGDQTMAQNPYGYGNRPQGVGGETATAARYNAGATGTLVSPPMELYAAHRAKVVEQGIDLLRANAVHPIAFGKFGETVAKWFDPMRIPEDIKFGVAEDSWRPRTLETEREDVVGAISLGVGSGTIQNQALEEKALQVFGLDDDIDDTQDWEVLAEKRLDALKEAVEMVGPPDEEMVVGIAEQAVMTGANPEEMLMDAQAMQLIQAAGAMPLPIDRPDIFKRFYEDAYLDEEVDKYPPVYKRAIITLWTLHQDAGAITAAQDTRRMVETQRPAQEPQQEQSMQQQAMQERMNQAGQVEQQNAAQEQEMAGRVLDEGSKEADHARAIEMQDRKFEQQKKLEQVKAKPGLHNKSKRRR